METVIVNDPQPIIVFEPHVQASMLWILLAILVALGLWCWENFPRE